MKLKTLKNKVNRTIEYDDVEIEVLVDIARFTYTGEPKTIKRFKIERLSASSKKLTLYAVGKAAGKKK